MTEPEFIEAGRELGTALLIGAIIADSRAPYITGDSAEERQRQYFLAYAVGKRGIWCL